MERWKMCMRYMGEIANREVVLIQYYNVLFHLIFRIGLDEYKKIF